MKRSFFNLPLLPCLALALAGLPVSTHAGEGDRPSRPDPRSDGCVGVVLETIQVSGLGKKVGKYSRFDLEKELARRNQALAASKAGPAKSAPRGPLPPIAPPPRRPPSVTEVNLGEIGESRHAPLASQATIPRSAYPRSQIKLRELEAKYIELSKNLIWKTPPGKVHPTLGFIPESETAMKGLIDRDIAGYSDAHGGTEFSGRVVSIVEDHAHPGVFFATVTDSKNVHTTFPINGVRALWVKEAGGTIVDIPVDTNKVAHSHPSQIMQAPGVVQAAQVSPEAAAIRAEFEAAVARAKDAEREKKVTPETLVARETAFRQAQEATARHESELRKPAVSITYEKDPFPAPAPRFPRERHLTRDSQGYIRISAGEIELPGSPGRRIPAPATLRRVVPTSEASSLVLQRLRLEGATIDPKVLHQPGSIGHVVSKDGKSFTVWVQDLDYYMPKEAREYPGAEAHGHDWRKNPDRAAKHKDWLAKAYEKAAFAFNTEQAWEIEGVKNGQVPMPAISPPWMAELGATMRPRAHLTVEPGFVVVHPQEVTLAGKKIVTEGVRRRRVEPGTEAELSFAVMKAHGFEPEGAAMSGGTRVGFIFRKGADRYMMKTQVIEKFLPAEVRNFPGYTDEPGSWKNHPDYPKKGEVWLLAAQRSAAIYYAAEHTMGRTLGGHGFNPAVPIRVEGLSELGSTLQKMEPGRKLGLALMEHPELENDPLVVQRKRAYEHYNPAYMRLLGEFFGVGAGYEANVNGTLQVELHGIDMKPRAFYPELRWDNTIVQEEVGPDGKVRLKSAIDIDW